MREARRRGPWRSRGAAPRGAAPGRHAHRLAGAPRRRGRGAGRRDASRRTSASCGASSQLEELVPLAGVDARPRRAATPGGRGRPTSSMPLISRAGGLGSPSRIGPMTPAAADEDERQEDERDDGRVPVLELAQLVGRLGRHEPDQHRQPSSGGMGMRLKMNRRMLIVRKARATSKREEPELRIDDRDAAAPAWRAGSAAGWPRSPPSRGWRGARRRPRAPRRAARPARFIGLTGVGLA